jgi:CelD/BcsL family acetyltransferase involved in cellulose biosynthesis
LSSKSQRKATQTHRRRAAAQGLVRVEVQAPKKDASLIRALAETLRSKTGKADALRSALTKALLHPEVKSAFDIFGSDLPDETFAGIFDQPRQRGWRKVDL